MNAIDLLIADHNRVRGLFKRFNEAKEAENESAMGELAGKIFEELDVHTTIEEEVFYPAVRDTSEEITELVDEGLQEHHVVKVLMKEIAEVPPAGEEWVAKMAVLIENVEHHAKEEETDLFPPLRSACGGDRLATLGDDLEERKAALGSPRPRRQDRSHQGGAHQAGPGPGDPRALADEPRRAGGHRRASLRLAISWSSGTGPRGRRPPRRPPT